MITRSCSTPDWTQTSSRRRPGAERSDGKRGVSPGPTNCGVLRALPQDDHPRDRTRSRTSHAPRRRIQSTQPHHPAVSYQRMETGGDRALISASMATRAGSTTFNVSSMARVAIVTSVANSTGTPYSRSIAKSPASTKPRPAKVTSAMAPAMLRPQSINPTCGRDKFNPSAASTNDKAATAASHRLSSTRPNEGPARPSMPLSPPARQGCQRRRSRGPEATETGADGARACEHDEVFQPQGHDCPRDFFPLLPSQVRASTGSAKSPVPDGSNVNSAWWNPATVT